MTECRLYLDMDGVFADFDAGVRRALGKRPESDDEMWAKVKKVPGFFAGLPLMPHALQLWEQVKMYHPMFLTALPNSLPIAAHQKRQWVDRYFGRLIPVVCTQSKTKWYYCAHGDILVDDRVKYRDLWKAHRGFFILYDDEHWDDHVERVHRLMEAQDAIY